MAEQVMFPTPDQMQVKSLYDQFLETGTLGDVVESDAEADEGLGEDDDTNTNSGGDVFSNDENDAGLQLNKKRAAEVERERLALAEKDTAVHWLRFTVLAVLLGAALTTCLLLYFYICNDQERDFEFVFESSASQVIKSFHSSVRRIALGANAMSVAITSYALDTNATWPMVTIPHFELRADTIRVMTKSINCAFIPLVLEKDRPAWENYVTQQIQDKDKLQESFDREQQFMYEQDATFGLDNIPFSAPPGNPLATRNFSESITMLRPQPDVPGLNQPDDTGPYLAFYQTSPTLPLPALPNMNVFTFPPLAPPAKNVLETQQPTLADNHVPLAMFNMFLARGQFRHTRASWVGDGATNFFYPVFDSFDKASRQLVGMVLTNIYWRLHFRDILPPNAVGIIAVVENSVNQTYTYRLDGSDVTFLGEGDLHDPKYDHMKMDTDLNKYLEETAGPETQSYTQIPLANNAIIYCLHLYPSQDMEDMYKTNEAIVSVLLVAAVFLFTSIVFLVYNTVVERRQKIVFERAVKSAAVVSNLFPEEVREELINSNALEQKKSNKQSVNDSWKTSSNVGAKPKRLVKKYKNVTIMFADIAGFTSWSSEREPEDVFELLETFYAAFDSLAVRHNVFKVEAIGDVYMCATGIPNSQPNHAIKICKFARDCIQKVGILTAKLAPILGEGTLSLGLRVGLHSGNVMGGILRGDKSRFQLFGDAVNTAALMESRGLLGMVHLSESTYKALEARGKGHLARPREEAVANGQSKLQTYFLTHNFLHPGSATAVLSTASTQVRDNKSPGGKSTRSLASTSKSMTSHGGDSESHSMDIIMDVDVEDVTNSVDMNQSGQRAGDGGDGGSVGSLRSRPHWQSMVAQVDSYRSLEGVDEQSL